MSDKPEQPERTRAYRIALVFAIILITGATIFYRAVESWSWVDAFYFSCIAVTTVGFGDITPTTDGAKIFTVFYIFAGISIVTLVLNERLRRHATAARRRQNPDPGEPSTGS